jgi:flagellar protein FliO/FliZ
VTTMGLLAMQQAPQLVGEGELTRGIAAVGVVLALLALGAWALRRGTFGPLNRKARGLIRVETTVPLGERRSLMVVSVEGRRLLLGLTPVQVSLVTELQRGDAFATTLDRASETERAAPDAQAHHG